MVPDRCEWFVSRQGLLRWDHPPTERGREETEGPVHTINIEYDFYMGETEVTQAQWIAVMGEIRRNDWGTGNDFPVYYISWVDIAAPRGFLEKINLLGQGKFRLPSEAEWEYACRAGTQTRFHFGDSLDCPDTEDCPAGGLPGNRSDYMWFRCKSREEGFLDQAHEVARLLPNQFGLFDMHGNVWEWCQDASHCNYEGAPTDGSAWENDQSGERMIRGGRWRNAVDGCRSAYRGAGGLFMMGKGGGFRLAMTP